MKSNQIINWILAPGSCNYSLLSSTFFNAVISCAFHFRKSWWQGKTQCTRSAEIKQKVKSGKLKEIKVKSLINRPVINYFVTRLLVLRKST